jgi:hypothetical protein
MPALIKVHKRLVDFTVLLGKRNFMSGKVIGHLKMATAAFEFLKVVRNGFCGHEFMPEDGAKQFSAQRIFFVSY